MDSQRKRRLPVVTKTKQPPNKTPCELTATGDAAQRSCHAPLRYELLAIWSVSLCTDTILDPSWPACIDCIQRRYQKTPYQPIGSVRNKLFSHSCRTTTTTTTHKQQGLPHSVSHTTEPRAYTMTHSPDLHHMYTTATQSCVRAEGQDLLGY